MNKPSYLRDISVLALPPRVNASNIDEVVAAMGQLGARRVVLDLGATVGVDSTALGAIVKFYREQLDAGGELALARPSEGVRRVLKVTRLEEVLVTFPSVEAASAPGAVAS
ncbi:MAG: STAS domain-containing protein [Polyangiaceae bacterium]|nr:STAS domain-containing protein [Polyangiaceae bacterium]